MHHEDGVARKLLVVDICISFDLETGHQIVLIQGKGQVVVLTNYGQHSDTERPTNFKKFSGPRCLIGYYGDVGKILREACSHMSRKKLPNII